MNYELPDSVDGLGGYCKVDVKNFAGGYRSLQSFGDFPSDTIEWSGTFTRNSQTDDMYSRMQQLLGIRQAQQSVTLTLGQFSYQVFVQKIELNMKLQYWIPYKIVLIPLSLNTPQVAQAPPGGLNSSGNTPPTAPQVIPPGSPAPPQNAAFQNSPQNVGQPNIGQLNSSNLLFGQAINNAPSFSNIPSQTLTSFTSFQQSLQMALQNSLGNPSLINSDALTDSFNTANTNAQTLLNSTDPSQAAYGAQTAPILGNISDALQNQSGVLYNGTFINPNLFDLATQYYQNASDWEVIATVNNLTTPFPIGTYSLTIPSQ